MQVYWKGSVRKCNIKIQVNCPQSCNLLSRMCANVLPPIGPYILKGHYVCYQLSDMIDALIKRVSVTYACYEMYAHRGKKVQLLVFWDHQEMDAILLIIGIAYGVCRIVIKSVQQCTYFLFFVNLLLVGVNYGQRTMQVCS